MKRPLALFLALLMALSLCACGGDTPPTKEEMLEIAETAYIGTLTEDFRNNVVAAKDKYAGKPFIVPGYVYEIAEEGCILSTSFSRGSNAYYVKANIPVDELKLLNTRDIIRVVGTITDEVETVEDYVSGSTFTRNYITMENAYWVEKIPELSGTVHISSGHEIFHYIEVPFLKSDSDRIKLIPILSAWPSLRVFEAAVAEGDTVTISSSDIKLSDGYYEVSCTPNNIKVEKAGQ